VELREQARLSCSPSTDQQDGFAAGDVANELLALVLSTEE